MGNGFRISRVLIALGFLLSVVAMGVFEWVLFNQEKSEQMNQLKLGRYKMEKIKNQSAAVRLKTAEAELEKIMIQEHFLFELQRDESSLHLKIQSLDWEVVKNCLLKFVPTLPVALKDMRMSCTEKNVIFEIDFVP